MRYIILIAALLGLTGCDAMKQVDESDDSITGTRAWYNKQAYEFCNGKENVALMEWNRKWGGYFIQCIDKRQRDI